MRCRNNAVGITPAEVIELGNVACLTEILHAQRHNVPVERLTDDVPVPTSPTIIPSSDCGYGRYPPPIAMSFFRLSRGYSKISTSSRLWTSDAHRPSRHRFPCHAGVALVDGPDRRPKYLPLNDPERNDVCHVLLRCLHSRHRQRRGGRLGQVTDQIVRMLEPNAQTDQPLGHASDVPCFLWDARMRRRGRMTNERFRPTK